MKKNFAITVLLITTILSMTFAFQQKTRAEKFRLEALEQKLVAEEQRRIAEKAKMLAEQNMLEAMRQRQLAALAGR